MKLLEAPVLSATRTRQLRVLEFLYDAPGRSSSQETPIEPLNGELGAEQVQDALQALVDTGLVASWASIAGLNGGILLPAGEDLVERVRRVRSSTVERNKAVRNALLHWIYDQGLGAHPTLDRFLDSEHNQFHGQPFSKSELHQASRWLRENGHIDGQGSWGGGIPRPSITAKGAQVVESGSDVNSPNAAPVQQTFNTQFNGPVSNAAVGSNNVNQTATTVDPQAVAAATKALDLVRETLEALVQAGADRAALTDALDQARSTDPAKEPGLFRAVLAKIKTTIVAGAGGALGGVVVEQIERALELLPG
ncbi:hypothetical protein [Cellulosimicrobium sp. 4261]|uniref:hypothetical protein n=1 Tax=Cellulosimicrobium sp. 4261 TaxID=3156458 RepID=UPI003399876B